MPRTIRLALCVALLLASCAAPPPPAPTPTRAPTPSAAPATPTPSPAEVSMRAPPRAQPLDRVEVQVIAPGRAGSAELRVYDGRSRLTGSWPFEIRDGRGAVTITARGALGQHSAVLVIDGQIAGASGALYTLDAATAIETGQPRFDDLERRARGFIERSVLSYVLDGERVRGYRSPDSPLLWLRDHTYQARGFRYFERDVTSLVRAFRRAQLPDGSFPDWLARPGYAAVPGRKQVEADVEYLFVQAVYEAWQATGDDAWLGENLSSMRRALTYTMGDPLRWDAGHGLVKRPYTIDTWDFEYGPATVDPTNGKPAPRHWIDERTRWGIFHGDNTGLAHALELLARMEERLGNAGEAERRRAEAAGIKERLDALSWNGSFYTHFVPLAPLDVPGVDTARQLSLSNAIALNRGGLRPSQGRDIVEEYFRRGASRDPAVFAEWYSIDPPFPAGSYGMAGRLGERPGEYVNGGLMPLVGGELARGAFRYGAERYGFEILHRYYFLVSTTGASYLWYYPAGNPGISGADTLPSDGWGASAMLAALIEGAAGVEDDGAVYRDVTLSPRWSATDDVREARVVARYAASQGYTAYEWAREEQGLSLEFTGSGERATVRLLLPQGVERVAAVTLDGQPRDFAIEDVFGSRYVVLEVGAGSGAIEVRW